MLILLKLLNMLLAILMKSEDRDSLLMEMRKQTLESYLIWLKMQFQNNKIALNYLQMALYLTSFKSSLQALLMIRTSVLWVHSSMDNPLKLLKKVILTTSQSLGFHIIKD